jgi:hypothetical protein
MGDELVSRIFFDLLVASVKVAAGSSANVKVESSLPGGDASALSACNGIHRGRGCDFGVLGGGSTSKTHLTHLLNRVGKTTV